MLEAYFSQTAEGIQFSRQQASRFAKEIADDFNPIHDVDAKRFCVPGDLLFALALSKYGLSQQMQFNFLDMVGDGVEIRFPESPGSEFPITDSNGKACLQIERSGEISSDETLIDNFVKAYVAFSGHAFPHILVPLMAEHGVMINPTRPLVMYVGMSISLERFDCINPTLELSQASLEVERKRGTAHIRFSLKDGDEVIGQGDKQMILSGLRPFDQPKIDKLVDEYNGRKLAFAG